MNSEIIYVESQSSCQLFFELSQKRVVNIANIIDIRMIAADNHFDNYDLPSCTWLKKNKAKKLFGPRTFSNWFKTRHQTSLGQHRDVC